MDFAKQLDRFDMGRNITICGHNFCEKESLQEKEYKTITNKYDRNCFSSIQKGHKDYMNLRITGP